MHSGGETDYYKSLDRYIEAGRHMHCAVEQLLKGRLETEVSLLFRWSARETSWFVHYGKMLILKYDVLWKKRRENG
jgi:hypothetical protein